MREVFTKRPSRWKSIKIDVLEVKRCFCTSNKFLKKFRDDSWSLIKKTPKWLEDLRARTIILFLLIWCINRNYKIAKLHRRVKEKFLMLLLKFQIIWSPFLRNLWKKKPRCEFEGLKSSKLWNFTKKWKISEKGFSQSFINIKVELGKNNKFTKGVSTWPSLHGYDGQLGQLSVKAAPLFDQFNIIWMFMHEKF